MRRSINALLRCVSVAAVVSLVPGAAPANASPERGPAAAAAYLNDVAAEQHIPGMAVAVVTLEDTEFEWMEGKDGNGRPVGRDSPFLIGSVAKSMTAALVLQRAEANELQLSDPIGDHLPWLVGTAPTIEELLTHSSGYSTADGLAVAERFDNTDGAVRRAAEDLEYSGTRGQYEYSDANYLILGALVEELEHRPFGEVLRTDLLEPLDMTDTATTSEAAADLPAGHRYWWGQPRKYSPGFDESGTPFGYVVSTLTDLARYVRAQAGDNPDVLSPAMLDRLHTPRVSSGDDRYGYGWRITASDEGTLTHHTGATPGYFAHLMLDSDGRAVAVLANAYSEARAPALAAVAENVLLTLDGKAPESATGDPVLSTLPWAIALIAVVGLVMAVMGRWRPIRRGLRWTLAGSAVALCGALWLLPDFVGSNWRVMRIWLPDSAYGLSIAIALWALAAASLATPRTSVRPRRQTKLASMASRSRTSSVPN